MRGKVKRFFRDRHVRWRASYRHFRRPPMVSVHGVRITIDYENMPPDLIDWLFLERHESQEVRQCRKFIRNGDRVLELGAGIGLIGTLCAQIAGSENVRCYEANPALEPLIRRNHRMNNVSPDLRIRAIGKAGVPKTQFYVCDNIISSSLIDRGDTREIEVDADPIDDVIADFRPTVIVCDIEGAEVDLLPDADLSGVDRVIIELHPKIVGEDRISELVADLARQGLHFETGQPHKVAVFSRSAQHADQGH